MAEWDVCCAARRVNDNGAELLLELANAEKLKKWNSITWQGFNTLQKTMTVLKRLATVIVFSEDSPIALLFSQVLKDNAHLELVQYALGELWNHYTLDPAIQQIKDVLYPGAVKVASRMFDTDENVAKLRRNLDMCWECDQYSPHTRTMMQIAAVAGINVLPTTRGHGEVRLGNVPFMLSQRGKALLYCLTTIVQNHLTVL